MGTIAQDDLPEVLQNELFGYILDSTEGFDALVKATEEYMPEGYKLFSVSQKTVSADANSIIRQTWLNLGLKPEYIEFIDIEYVDQDSKEVLWTYRGYNMKKGTTTLPGDFHTFKKLVPKSDSYYILSGVPSLPVVNGKVQIPMAKVSKADYDAQYDFLSVYNVATGECLKMDVSKAQVAKGAAGIASDVMEKLKALIPAGYVVYNLGSGDSARGDSWNGYTIYVIPEKDAPKDPGKPKAAKSHIEENTSSEEAENGKENAGENGNAVVSQNGGETEVTNFKTAEEEDTALGIPGAAVTAFVLSGAGMVLSRRKKHSK